MVGMFANRLNDLLVVLPLVYTESLQVEDAGVTMWMRIYTGVFFSVAFSGRLQIKEKDVPTL